MASMAAEYHAQRGQRLLDAAKWEAAERAFAEAIWNAGDRASTQMLVGRAAALMRCSSSWEQKAQAMLAANSKSCESPQFWALAMRTFLEILDSLDGRQIDLSRASRRLLEEIRQGVADLVSNGTKTFQRYLDAGNRLAWSWAAALVAVADWIYAFQGVEAGRNGRHPFRPIAELLYHPVAVSDLVSLFDDPETRDEIERQVMHRARWQMTKFAKTHRGARQAPHHPGLSLFGLRVL